MASAPVASGSVCSTCSDGRYIASFSTSSAIRFIVATASTGYWPAADSADSMTASAPSKMAVGDVGDFGARRHRARDHRFQHLRGDDDRLAGAAAQARHVLLHAGDLFQRHLDAEIAARDHQRIGEIEDIVEPRHRLRFLDLGHHRGAPARDLLRLGDVLRTLNERQRHPIDARFERGFKVGEVFWRERRERNDGVGQADALAVRHFAADLDARHDALRADLGRHQAQLAVVDEQRVAGLDGGENFRMRQLHAGGIAGRRVGIEGEVLALVDLGRSRS